MTFDGTKYVESVKGILISFLKEKLPEADVFTAFPNVDSDNFSLKKPAVYVEFNRDYNV